MANKNLPTSYTVYQTSNGTNAVPYGTTTIPTTISHPYARKPHTDPYGEGRPVPLAPSPYPTMQPPPQSLDSQKLDKIIELLGIIADKLGSGLA